jgi:metallo-beta-lactamase family protein
MQATLRFHGAAREVTGSMHLVEVNGRIIALDCGLFQGKRSDANAKNMSFPCPPAKIDAVILSHAHIDHCGKLPRLVRDGFKGPIYATSPTCDLTEILLADSAHIQHEDTLYWNKKRVLRGDKPIEPLYTVEDAHAAVALFRPRIMNEFFEVLPGVRARFVEAGHMLGSASISLEIDRGAGQAPTRVTYSGDMGRFGMEILRDPDPLPECDYLIMESTYGGRVTPDPESMRDQLAEVINHTVERGGKIIVPSFAVGRTQVIVYDYHVLLVQKKLHNKVPVFIDSPLAVQATEVFRRHPEVYDREARAMRRLTGNMFDPDGVQYITNVEESKALHDRHEPMIIISASGMCEVGRILHHLKNNIEDPHNTILIVGYQAANTLGRRLVEKAKRVTIFGESYDVRAKLKVLNGFSAHANANELLKAAKPLAGKVKRAFLVHGDPDQSEKLAGTLRQEGFPSVTIPEPGQACRLE